MSHLPAAGLAPAVHGLQVGIVTELTGDPDNEHRIRVKVPLAGMDEQGVWARVATLDAGDQRGTVFRPEKDDDCDLRYTLSFEEGAKIMGCPIPTRRWLVLPSGSTGRYS